MRVVLDTSVLVSGFLSRTSPPGNLLLLWTYDYYELLISEHILDEFARTLAKPFFRQRLTPDAVSAAVALLRREARLISPTLSIQGVATHPEDDLILATAVAGRANYLVTGDAKLLRLETFEDVRLRSPRQFLEILRTEGP